MGILSPNILKPRTSGLKALVDSDDGLIRTGLLASWLAKNGMIDNIGLSPKRYSPAAVGGTIKYVDKNATGSGNGSSWANAYTTIQAGLNAALVAGTTVLVAAGTYTEVLSFAAAGIKLIGATGDPEDVAVDSTGLNNHTCYSSRANTFVDGMTFKGAGTSKYNLYFDNSYSVGRVVLDGGYAGLRLPGTSSGSFKLLNIKNPTATGIVFNSSNQHRINTLMITNAGGLGADLYGGSGGITCDTAIITGCKGGALIASNYSGASVFKNLIQAGNYRSQSAILFGMISGAGSLTIDHIYSLPNHHSPTYNVGGVVNNGGCIGLSNASVLPLFVKSPYPVFLSFTIDDINSVDFFDDFSALCEEFGFRATLAVNTATADASTWTKCSGYIARGHEIASHSVTHLNLTTLTEQQIIDELVNSKAAIEAGIPGYTCETFMAPNAAVNATVIAQAKLAGYTGVGGAVNLVANISPVDIYNQPRINCDVPLGTTSIKNNAAALIEYFANIGASVDIAGHDPSYPSSNFTLDQWRALFEEIVKHPNITVCLFSEKTELLKSYNPSGDLAVVGSVYTRTLINEADYRLHADSPCIGAGVSPFTNGDGDQHDADGYMVWSDVFDAQVYHWLDGVDIGAYAYGGSGKVFHSLRVDKSWPPFPELYDVIGLNNAVYNADGTSATFATDTLALAGLASLADDQKLWGGTKQAALYSVDMSAQAARIKRAVGDAT